MVNTFETDREPSQAGFDVFQTTLSESRYFQSLPPAEKTALFHRYLAELQQESRQHIQVISDSILAEPPSGEYVLSAELQTKARQAVQTLHQLAITTADDPLALEARLTQDWRSTLGSNTLAQLLVDKANEIFTLHDFAPAEQDLPDPTTLSEKIRSVFTGGSRYARYDLYKHPVYLNLLYHETEALLGMDLAEIANSPDRHVTFVSSGSATTKRIVEAIRDSRHVLLPDASSRRLYLYQGNDHPYFETDKVLLNAVSATSGLYPDETGLEGASLWKTEDQIEQPADALVYRRQPQTDIFFSRLPHDESRLFYCLNIALGHPGIHVFWLENIGNNSKMDVPAIHKLFEMVKKLGSWSKFSEKHKIVFCFDTSVLGGPLDSFADYLHRFETAPQYAGALTEFADYLRHADAGINIMITSSLTKFASLGLNKANVGLIYGQGPDMDVIFKHIYGFQTTEGYPSLHTLAAMPLVSGDVLRERKKRFGDNALFLAKSLEEKYSGDKVRIVYPGLDTHPDHQTVLDQYEGYAGPFFFLEFSTSDQAWAFLAEIKHHHGQHIDIGTSYGFNKTRLELRNGAEAEDIRTVRVAVGTENIRQSLLVLQALENSIDAVSNRVDAS